MMKNILNVVAMALAVVLPGCSGETAGQDLVLRYDSPAEYFEEALPIGNGRIGAMVYGGVGEDRLTLNDITLWTGEPADNCAPDGSREALNAVREALERDDYRAADVLQCGMQGDYTNNYQPLGTLIVEFAGEGVVDGYSRNLDIFDAVASTSYRRDGYNVRRRYFASAPDSVIVMEVDTDEPDGLTLAVSFESKLPCEVVADGNRIVGRGYAAYKSMPGYTGDAENSFMYDEGRGVHYMTIVGVEADGGTVEANDSGRICVTGANRVVLKLVNATSFNGFESDPVSDGRDYVTEALRLMAKVEGMPVDELICRHKADFNELMGRVALDLGDTDEAISCLPTDEQLKRYTDSVCCNPDLEELYFQYGRYLLASSSRTPGVPANLQGLWNEKMLPPWSSNYTLNINLEENYWPVNVANLSELEEPLIGFIENISRNGSDVACNYYGMPGWCTGHNSDIWAMANPVGCGGGDPVWANWTMGGAWLVTHVYDHYLFTGDVDFLRKYYPVMKGAAEFCMAWLVVRDGELVTSPGTSPENVYVADDGYRGATLYGCTADLAITRQCLADTRDAAALLGVDADMVESISYVLDHIHPYMIGAGGNLQEWYHDWADADPKHRHQSHLYGVFPGRHITIDDDPELCRAVGRSLEIKGDDTTGWSTGWRVNLYSRLGDGESAYRMYRRLLRFVTPDDYRGDDARRGGGTYPNLFDAHSPFQIDGNFGGTAGVAEMLLQSSSEKIVLLPALPKEWRDGRFSGLCARGGWVVDAEWRDGRVVYCRIKSRNGGHTVVRVNDESRDVVLSAGGEVVLRL